MTPDVPSAVDASELKQTIARFAIPDNRKAIIQVLNTFLPYGILWAVMLHLVMTGRPYSWTLLLAVPAALLLVRIFIIFHDCGHGSFTTSKTVNRVLGFISGVLTFTPFDDWTWAHAVHHGTAGDLDRRGTGDVWTLTVDEYRALPRWKRAVYRVFRYPVFLFFVVPGILFLVIQRFPTKGTGAKQRKSVWLTDLAIALILLAAHLTIGLTAYLKVQLPIILIAATAGVWLFYVQHQFETVYWAHSDDRDPVRVALEGSSFYRLPKLLQWCSGNIGFHHIHHLNARVPNYRLEACQRALPPLPGVCELTLLSSLRCMAYRLWDERTRRMRSFRELRQSES